MPRVPYSPVPSAQPSTQGTPSVSVNTPGAAFGTTIADAVQGLGKTMEGVGGELFSRAVAMQELRNETEAREADTKYMIDVGKMHAEYSAKEGRERVEAFDGYAKGMDTLRKQYRDGLSNDSARRMFDSNSLSTMGRTIFNGAGAAATAQRDWAKGEAASSISVLTKTAQDNPRDDVLHQRNLTLARQSAETLAGAQGFEPGSAREQELYRKVSSALWSGRIHGLGETSPSEAQTMLDQHKTDLTEQDRERLTGFIQSQSRSIESINIANDVYTRGAESGTSMKDMEEEARARAKQLRPNDPVLAQHAVSALQGRFNQDRHATTIERIENQQTIDGAIMNGVRDVQQLRADPKVAAAIDALPKDKQMSIPGQINRYNAARDKVTNQENYQTIYGRSINDVAAFIDTDLTKENLSQADIRSFQKLQQKLKEIPGADPRVQRAVGIIQGSMAAQLQALGIFKRTTDNKDDYDKFTGSLSTALDLWMETHGKPPTAKDINETIGPQLIKQHAEPGWFNLSTFGGKDVGTHNLSDPFFKQDVTTKEAAKWIDDFKSNSVADGQGEPTDEQAYRAYMRAMLQQFYPAKKGDKQK